MSGVVLLSKLLPMMREVLHPPVWIAAKNKPLMSVKSNGEQCKEDFSNFCKDYLGVTPRMNKKDVKSAHELPNK